MKFDDQLAAYLYENKSLRLEGIGTFTLDPKVSVPSVQEKEIYYPIEGLSFTYNPKSDTDESVITFLVKRLGKIQPLIRSDLESYLSNIKQFINLGKPYTIEGVGTLSKNNQGTYEFTPGNFLPAKEELHPKRENIEHNYPVKTRSSAGRVFVVILIVVAALAALGGIGWGVSTLIAKHQSAAPAQEAETGSVAMSEGSEGVDKTASTSSKPGTTTASGFTTGMNSTDTVSYKLVFEVTKFKERAHKRTMQLRSYNTFNKYDTVHVNDSIRYRLFIPLKIRNADTIRYKDSLSRFLGRKVFLVRQ